ncbi:uncharacterized protein G6M90_00g086840 [Metarhizium brunneum]|uniref:Uncharacterized protein n=1 Tax=Metarhizium brunneum TaxID=500148 RepID=A0A7D5V1V5_9HYPO|nr:hypothetical protein E5D57_002466 [Metarhizium anisopliae]QLI72494.1 hypothetical protein G6M90_00g086840 [Metarhizium brunneum]
MSLVNLISSGHIPAPEFRPLALFQMAFGHLDVASSDRQPGGLQVGLLEGVLMPLWSQSYQTFSVVAQAQGLIAA